jgi:ubiquinone/menaquinone biosynthesis C-methylase UbiE
VFGNGSEKIVGTDVSLLVARAAKKRMEDQWGGWRKATVSDARQQAFKSNVFDEIISNSTLDHFSGKKDIIESLRELRRVLKPGGTLIITLDNPWNPVVSVRNRLPYRWLKFLGVIPFYMGVTLSRSELIRALESNGFRVEDSTAIVHSPRILAIWAGHILARLGWGRTKAVLHHLLRGFEFLERLPTKSLTGYYVAVKARKT